MIGKKITSLTSDPVTEKQKQKIGKKKENYIVSTYKKDIKTDRKESISYGVTEGVSHPGSKKTKNKKTKNKKPQKQTNKQKQKGKPRAFLFLEAASKSEGGTFKRRQRSTMPNAVKRGRDGLPVAAECSS